MRKHGVGHHSPIEETLAWITPGPPPEGFPTAQTITQGQTKTLRVTDAAIIFDTSAGAQATATADMITPLFIGQEWTFSWFVWGTMMTPPTIVAPAGILMVPFSGMPSSGTGGLVSTTTISTPGASYTLKWNGTYLTAA